MNKKNKYLCIGLFIVIGVHTIHAMFLRKIKLPPRLSQLRIKKGFSKQIHSLFTEDLIKKELSLNLGFINVIRNFLVYIENTNSLGLFGWRSKIKTPENSKRQKMLHISSSIRNAIVQLEDKIKNFQKTDVPQLQQYTAYIESEIHNLYSLQKNFNTTITIQDAYVFFGLLTSINYIEKGLDDIEKIVKKTPQELEKE